MPVYANNAVVNNLTQHLRDPKSEIRIQSAEKLGEFCSYSALPYLLWVARKDKDEKVRRIAEIAAHSMFPTFDAGSRVLAGRTPGGTPVKHPNPLGQASHIMDWFERYALTKTGRSAEIEKGVEIPTDSDMETMVMAYLLDNGHYDVYQLSPAGVVGAIGVGIIARYLEVPENAGVIKGDALRDAIWGMRAFRRAFLKYSEKGTVQDNGLLH